MYVSSKMGTNITVTSANVSTLPTTHYPACSRRDKQQSLVFIAIAIVTLLAHTFINALILINNLYRRVRYMILMNLSVADFFTAIVSISTSLVANWSLISEEHISCDLVMQVSNTSTADSKKGFIP